MFDLSETTKLTELTIPFSQISNKLRICRLIFTGAKLIYPQGFRDRTIDDKNYLPPDTVCVDFLYLGKRMGYFYGKSPFRGNAP